MKGISIAVETVVYLILAVTVLTVAIGFFLSQAGPAQRQYELEADRQNHCGAYTVQDFGCKGNGGSPVNQDKNRELLQKLGTACYELGRLQSVTYEGCGTNSAPLTCIQSCCLACPQKK